MEDALQLPELEKFLTPKEVHLSIFYFILSTSNLNMLTFQIERLRLQQKVK
uniref:Uncharacterized protein n=1 Tax=Heterorhabditis bacteriophora TaxID=37862 RepID=A0A1I7XBB6_HETBA